MMSLHSSDVRSVSLSNSAVPEMALEQALAGLSAGVSGDFLAMDIRHATQQIASITGRIDVEDLLANILVSFVLGSEGEEIEEKSKR